MNGQLPLFYPLKETSAHVYLYSSSYVAPEILHQPIFKAQGSEENKVTSFDQLDPEKESLRQVWFLACMTHNTMRNFFKFNFNL